MSRPTSLRPLAGESWGGARDSLLCMRGRARVGVIVTEEASL